MYQIKDTLLFAFAQGLYERLTLGDAFGRTHPTNQDWNEAYDRGANLADWFPYPRFMDWIALAFAQGCYERLTLGDAFGRTHETNQDWNEAYDRGANLADWLTLRRKD